MLIGNSRITLRDFEPADRAAFVEYQMDPRYRSLYDLDDNPVRANELFDLFLNWQMEDPRRNYQLGVFDNATKRLCGCAGLRVRPEGSETAVFGIELAPSEWGRYRIALDVTACLLKHGFEILQFQKIVGDTASGNGRVEKLARWFGAQITDRRDGPLWMRKRGWHEVDWALTRDEWRHSNHQKRRRTTSDLKVIE
jgi:[ribosomal protein S5]-alanine N-acetyltransferase